MTHASRPWRVYRGGLVTCRDDKATVAAIASQVDWWQDGCLVVDPSGTITYAGPASKADAWPADHELIDLPGCLILPGLIDTHVHFPQLDMIGAYAGELLEWLDQHTFPHEARLLQDPQSVAATAHVFIDELLAHGTTTACIYGPSKGGPAEQLFAALAQSGLRAIVGKTSMDRHAPAALCESVQDDLAHTRRLIQTYHNYAGKQRLFYALTPRFAPSCSAEMLTALGQLKQGDPSLYVQTHFAENLDEIAWVRELYPNLADYLAVYEHFQLVGPQTILAHAIHMTPRERAAVRDYQAVIAHCPSSNLFLGSGLFAAQACRDEGMKVTLGTDCGAGTSLSLWATIREAYKVAKIRGEDWAPQSLFASATLQAARALGLDSLTGSLTAGKRADFQVINPTLSRLLKRRLARLDDVDQLLFALAHHCDDRCVEAVLVDGQILRGSFKP
jgi:guanine deaminase